ncbi:hypothetical protein BO71DRAFT_147743 [Aspergillus ellipticus CBS 707.79]|uniref:Uncharacterized protein n=1 Tax=Aspergillus ellipticus CBS 707.79 TaxID=1448320 RepID=A0A319CTT2_9EURO|nr:hypothetical protein BO71DRAFT_147743 [Aspergillus ellipticus CBS 707.79]
MAHASQWRGGDVRFEFTETRGRPAKSGGSRDRLCHPLALSLFFLLLVLSPRSTLLFRTSFDIMPSNPILRSKQRDCDTDTSARFVPNNGHVILTAVPPLRFYPGGLDTPGRGDAAVRLREISHTSSEPLSLTATVRESRAKQVSLSRSKAIPIRCLWPSIKDNCPRNIFEMYKTYCCPCAALTPYPIPFPGGEDNGRKRRPQA